MGPLFLFLSPYFPLDRGPGCISLSLVVVAMAPPCFRMYVSVQSWSVLLSLMCVGTTLRAHIQYSTRITHVPGGGEGGGWVCQVKIKSHSRLRIIILAQNLSRQPQTGTHLPIGLTLPQRTG